MAALVAAVGCVAWVASSTASTRSRTPTPSGTLHIFWTSEFAAAMNPTIRAFERAYPKVHVALQSTPGSNIQNVLVPEIQGGNPPDLAYTCAGSGTPYCEGALGPAGAKDLLPVSGPWTSGVIPSVSKYLKYGGKFYAAPIAIAPEAIFYNTSIFKSLKLVPPTRFSQLLTDCKKIAAAGKAPFVLEPPIITPSYFFDTLSTHLVFAKDPNWISQEIAHKTTFATTPGWREVVNDWVAMKNDQCINANEAGNTPTEALTAMARGQAAMILVSSDAYSQIKAINPKVKLSSFDMPGDTASERGSTIGIIMNMDHFKGGHNPVAADAFLNFFEQPAQLARFAKLADVLAVPEYAAGKFPSYLAPLESDAKYRTIPEPSTGYPSPTWLTEVDPSLISLLTGQTTVAQELQTMQNGFFGTTG